MSVFYHVESNEVNYVFTKVRLLSSMEILATASLDLFIVSPVINSGKTTAVRKFKQFWRWQW